MAKSKKKDYLVHIEMARQELANVLAASCMYASAMKNGILMDCSKKGFMLSSVEYHSAAALVIAVSKKYDSDFKYELTGPDEHIKFDPEDLKKLASFYKNAGDKETAATMTIREKWITCTVSNLTKRLRRDPDPGAVMESTTLDSFQRFYDGLREVGEFNSAELLSTIKGLASFKKGVEGYFITFKENKKMFEIIRNLGVNDDVGIDMTEVIMNWQKKDLSATYNIYELSNALKYVSKLSDTITILGESEHPMIFTHRGTEPEKGREYPEQLEFWYTIAPVIVEE